MKVGVLGAGLTGLSAALRLARAGVDDIILIEKGNDVGGLASSVNLNGFIFDFSGHRFWTKNQELLSFLRDLLQEDLVLTPRKSSIYVKGVKLNYPPDIQEFIRTMPKIDVINCLALYTLGRLQAKLPQKSENSMWDWGLHHFGRGFFELYISTYTTKSWGIPPQNISSFWAKQRIKVPSIWKPTLRAILNWPPPADPGYGTEFYYPRKGIGTIAQAIRRQLSKHPNVRLETDSTIVNLGANNDSIKTITYIKNEAVLNEDVDHVISTIPLEDLVPIIENVEQEMIDAVNGLKYRSMIFVFLVLDKPFVGDDSWVYVPDPSVIFTRFYEPRNWSEHCVLPGKTSLCVEIHCDVTDEIWEMSERSITSSVIAGLEKMNLAKEEEVVSSAVYRLHRAYPMTVQPKYLSIADRVLKNVKRYNNLICAGRQGLYRYINMDHAVEMGFASADFVVGKASKDAVYNIAADESYFEEKIAK